MEHLVNNSNSPMCKIVTDEKLRLDIQTLILGYWPNRQNDYFPGPLPVSLELKNFYKLKNYPYLICVKSDGTRFLFLHYNSRSYLIDRTFKIREVFINFKEDPKIFLYDGELIEKNNGEWYYIIHDCICMENINVSTEDFDDRYESIQTTMSEYICDDDVQSPVIKLGIKKFFKFDMIDQFKKYIKEIDHKTDGYILTPLKLPIGTGTQYSLFKWKPIKSHTFDFKITDDDKIYYVYVSQDKGEILFATVDKNSEDGIKFKKELNEINYTSGSIVECIYDDNTKCYVPIMIRKDKIHPNSLYTIDKTMLNIRENITEAELFTLNPCKR